MKIKTISSIILTVFIMESCHSTKNEILVTDIYNNAVSDVTIKVFNENDSQQEKVLSSTKTNANGKCWISSFEQGIQLVIFKQGYMKRSILVPKNGFPKTIILPPGEPGIYSNNKLMEKQKFEFQKEGMQGLMIPAYYDGNYSINATASPTEIQQPIFLAADSKSTLGQNIFSQKESIYVCPISKDGSFAKYHQGRSKTQKATYSQEVILDATDLKNSGLVQTSIRVYKITKIAAGEYVIYIAGGNMLDNELHPTEDNGCYYIKIK